MLCFIVDFRSLGICYTWDMWCLMVVLYIFCSAFRPMSFGFCSFWLSGCKPPAKLDYSLRIRTTSFRKPYRTTLTPLLRTATKKHAENRKQPEKKATHQHKKTIPMPLENHPEPRAAKQLFTNSCKSSWLLSSCSRPMTFHWQSGLEHSFRKLKKRRFAFEGINFGEKNGLDVEATDIFWPRVKKKIPF